MAGEFDVNRELEGESGAAAAGGVPRADLARQRAGRAHRRRDPDHADDPPQRQGPRVQGRLHHRLRGRRLPALPLDRRGQPRGGAAPLLRRPDPRPRAARAHLRAPPQHLRLAGTGHPLALPRRDPARPGRAPLDRACRRPAGASAARPPASSGFQAVPEPRPGARARRRRRRRPRLLRRGRRHRGRAGQRGRRPLPGRAGTSASSWPTTRRSRRPHS